MVEILRGNYHHGLVIKEYREQRGMTQARLAELWPKAAKFGGGEGVNVTYIQDIEHGKKHIDDQRTLRKLCDMLDIPHWKFGLSEYDPFNPQALPGRGKSMYNETLDTAACLLEDSWHLRRAVPLPRVEKSVHRLNELFAYFFENTPPPSRLEARFLGLYAQVQRLNAVMDVERQRYEKALSTFEYMHVIAKQSGEPTILALSLMGMGTELERAGKQQEAVDRLEEARDVSFRATRQIAALIHAYLARAYASNGDALHFQRAIDTAQKLATDLDKRYGDGTDFVYHSLSGVLAERSFGYLDTGEPKKTLAMKDEIKAQIAAEHNSWLDAWIPLDWARAYKMLGEVEASVEAGLLFFRKALTLKSPHAQSRAFALLVSLEKAGYGDVGDVQQFREELEQSYRDHNLQR
jgi:transcriptional regulator with XRE-family HTH domain